jgi:hypothetical protein
MVTDVWITVQLISYCAVSAVLWKNISGNEAVNAVTAKVFFPDTELNNTDTKVWPPAVYN